MTTLEYTLVTLAVLVLIAFALALFFMLSNHKIEVADAELEVAIKLSASGNNHYLLRIDSKARHEYLLSCYEVHTRPTRAVPYSVYLAEVAKQGHLLVTID